MRNYLLLANTAAGGADEAVIDGARSSLRAAGVEAEVAWCSEPGDVDAALDRLDDRTLVVCGGDGSIHTTVTRLHARGELRVPVGLLPLGTGNDLARGVGLPFDDAEAAVAALLAGRPQPVDLLSDDRDRLCVNALHAGVGAAAAAKADALKTTLGDVAYQVGALLAGFSEEGVEARVVVDDRPLVEDTVLMVAVCNGPSFGGGTLAAPDADPTDGLLDVVAVTATNPLERAAFGLALQRGDHLDRDDVHVARGREVTIASAGMRYDVDGEVGEVAERERTWRVLPAAWHLVR